MKLFTGVSLLAVFALPLPLYAAAISGTVTDRTGNKPAAGDTAVLLDLTQTMQESARTTIDVHGHFSFTVPDLTAMHVIRVEHQTAAYYAPVPPNTATVNLDVFDVAETVPGVHVYADVSRIQTDSQGLNVTESFTVRNESKPPRTQFSDHAFDFYLPTGAAVQDGAASGPGGMTVRNTPVSLQDNNHHAFIFPLRPGETHLQVSYQLPYSGSFEFHPAVSTPTDSLAVTLPTGMSFSGSGFQVFHGSSDQPGTVTYLMSDVRPGTQLLYKVSGSGTLPAQMPSTGPQSGGMGALTAQGSAPGGGLGAPIATPDPLAKYEWWIVSLVGLALVIVSAFMLRNRAGLQTSAAGGAISPGFVPPALASAVPSGVKLMAGKPPIATAEPQIAPPPSWEDAPHAMPSSTASPASAPRSPMLLDLKEELWGVETERLQGKLSEEESVQLRSALEILMRRALARRSTGA